MWIEQGQSDRDRGPRVFNTMELADEAERTMRDAKAVVLEASEPIPAASDVVAPDTGAVLLESAKALNGARSRLMELDGRLAAMREKYNDLRKLEEILADARKQRANLFADALLSGKEANTTAVDKRCAGALVALEKRRDEATAVARALEILQAQRAATDSELAECRGALRSSPRGTSERDRSDLFYDSEISRSHR